MNESLRVHYLQYFRIVIVALACVFMTSCGNEADLENVSLQRRPASGTPVPLKVDKENQGKRCEAKLFDHGNLPEENTPEYKRCLYLQKELNQAAWDGNVEAIRKGLERGANVNAGYYQQSGPLGMAIRKGRTEAVHLLIENGADVNAKYLWDETPLHRAVDYNFYDIARTLVEAGADPCSKGIDDGSLKRFTALDIAKEKGHKEMITLLKKAGADNCP
jgi:hypothetical protein